MQIEEMYEEKIRKIPTERFEGLIQSEMSSPQNQNNKNDDYIRVVDEDSNASNARSLDKTFSEYTSYEQLAQGSPIRIPKPD